MYTCKAFSIGTLFNNDSYIFRFLNADFNKIRRNVIRSIAHKLPAVSALIVAALQEKYKMRSSQYCNK